MYRKFTPIVAIQLFASFAVNILLVVLTGLIYRNNGNVSILMITMTIPALIFSKVFGRLIDRNYSKKVLMFLNIILIVSIVILLVNKLYNNNWSLYSFSFCAYTFDLFIRIHLQVAVTDLTSQQHYLKLNALLNIIENIGIVIGPVIGGILLQRNFSYYAFIIIGIVYVCTFLSVVFTIAHHVSGIEKEPASMPNETSNLTNKYEKNILKEIFFAACLFAFAIALINVRQISFVITHYDTAEIGYSITESMWGLGMVLGCFTILFFDKKLSTHRLIGLNYLFLTACVIMLVISHYYYLAILLFLLLGIGNITISIGFTTLIQKTSDKTNMGKILGAKNLWQQIATIAAMGCVGVLESRISSEIIYIFAGIFLLIGGGFILYFCKRWTDLPPKFDHVEC